MYLCFIDESQTPPNPGQQNRPPYFIIAGVVIHEAQWHGISDDLKALKARPEFNVAGEIKWRFFGPTNKDPANSVAHLDQTARDEFRVSVAVQIGPEQTVSLRPTGIYRVTNPLTIL